MDYLEEIDYTHAGFADVYDELPLWSAPFGLLLLERVPVKRGMAILDVGAGTGFLSIELAQRCGSDAEVIAVDPWESAIKRLQRKLDYMDIQNVRLITGDVEDVDIPDQSIDLVVSNLGINNFKNPEKALCKCFRVAKPNGRFVLTTNLMGHMHEFYDVFRETLIDVKLGGRLAAFDEHVRHRGTIASVGEMLVRAGFEIKNVSTDSFTMRFADGSSFLRHYFIRLGFLSAWKSIIEGEALEDIFKTLEHRLNGYASRHGELLLTIPMACFEAQK